MQALPLALLALLAQSGARHALAEAKAVEAAGKDEGFCPAELRPLLQLASSPDAALFSSYLETCRSMQVRPSADALISLQLGSSRLTVRPNGASPFGDLELRALVMLLEANNGSKLEGLRYLDLSSGSLGPSGVLLLTHLLRHPSCRLEELDISSQDVDRESVCSMASAVRQSRTLRTLRMSGCALGDEGGQIFADLLENRSADQTLRLLDIQNNYISFDMCNTLKEVAKDAKVTVHLAGNRVLDEVFNSVSHGFGEILAIIGTIFLGKKMGCANRPAYQVWSAVMYCTALNTLYLASTLYHAFFALGRTTVYVFSILDYSGIFLLIAGSYSPLLGISLYEHWWASVLQALMWSAAITGVYTAAFYTGPYSQVLRLSLYISMGWAVVVCIRPLARQLGACGTFLLFIGGCLYTGGVPFFVRGRHTMGFPDHTIWHLFVVAGSIAHYICIYKYVIGGKEVHNPDTADTDRFSERHYTVNDAWVPLQPL